MNVLLINKASNIACFVVQSIKGGSLYQRLTMSKQNSISYYYATIFFLLEILLEMFLLEILSHFGLT